MFYYIDSSYLVKVNENLEQAFEKQKEENIILKKKNNGLQDRFIELEKRTLTSTTNETLLRQSNASLPDLNGFIGDLSRIVGSLAPIEKTSIGNERLSSV